MTSKSRTVDCRELALVKLIRNVQDTAIEKYDKRIPRAINSYTYIICIIKKKVSVSVWQPHPIRKRRQERKILAQ